MSNFADIIEHEEPKEESYIYKAVATKTNYGVTAGNRLITGLELQPVEDCGYDLLTEELLNVGGEVIIHFPKEGIIEGAKYEVFAVNESRDWETGLVDDYELELRKVKH